MERSYHLLLGCHIRDREKMTTLLSGMEVHADFFVFYICDVFDGKPLESLSGLLERPLLDLWQGFVDKNFDHEKLCDLLESIFWNYPNMVCITYSGIVDTLVSMSVKKYRQFIETQCRAE